MDKVFQKRRAKLMSQMGEGSLALIPSAPISIRNGDVTYPYRQDSDFYYLTGFTAPEALLVLMPGRAEGEFVLLLPERDPKIERWEGPMVGLEKAKTEFGANESFDINHMNTLLPQWFETAQKIYFPAGSMPELDEQVHDWWRAAHAHTEQVSATECFVNLDILLHRMRLIKDETEIECLRQASAITAKAHSRGMRRCESGCWEYQLEGEYLHEMMQHGCRDVAYPSIVAGGSNACVLHYITNNQKLKAGDLVLVDAGAEYNHYAADVTRTYPVNGEFSEAQRKVYEIVLAAQLAGIDAVKPGATWEVVNGIVNKVLTEGLIELGLLEGNVDALVQAEAYKPFYMHRAGHWLGLDVHDVGPYQENKQPIKFEPGMVLTVEPGLYLGTDVPAPWQNIGIRIEDDVLVTETGYEVLSHAAPKTIDEIEACMKSESFLCKN